MSSTLRGLVLFATLLISAAPAERIAIQSRLVVLDNARVIDGSGKPPIEHARIVIEGDQIVHIGAGAEVPVPPQAR